jgi:DNA-directed RNA polymerase specialized sigma24 family protein
VKRMHARDAAAVDAAMAGLPEDQRTALASLVAGF